MVFEGPIEKVEFRTPESLALCQISKCPRLAGQKCMETKCLQNPKRVKHFEQYGVWEG